MKFPWQKEKMPAPQAVVTSPMRARNLELLGRLGFRVASSLPQERNDGAPQLRPIREIAARLMALDALFTWVADLEVEPDRITAYIERNGLAEWLTDEERPLVEMPRDEAHEEHVDAIGWKLENMWGLAWVLGFDPEPAMSGQIEEPITRSMLLDFLPGLEATVDDLVKKATPRSVHVVDEMEDRFYCLHNAVRGAQMGGKTVPPGFHPLAEGGAIHERRQALTWCLSPEVDWDDTDVST